MAKTNEATDKREPKTFVESKKVAKEGGTIAGNAGKQIESKMGKKVISKNNFQTMQERKRIIR